MLSLFVLIMNSCGNAFMMSFINSYVGEVEAGGATNRLQTFFYQFVFMNSAFTPLYSIFPVAPLILTLSYFTSIAILAGLNVIAHLCHKNQIARNAEKPDDITRLPFGLHDSETFIKAINLFANNASRPINALYVAGLFAAAFYGSSVMVIASISMLSLNYLYQHGWFPSFVEKPYFFFCAILLVAATFGMDSWVGLGFTVVNLSYFIYDYVQTNIRGVQSASSQFPIATKEHQVSLKSAPDKTLRNVMRLIDELKHKPIRPTYNHFQESGVLTNRLLGNRPKLTRQELEEFITLFDELDFNKKSLRDTILNEMVSHDKFNQKSQHDLILDLGLIPDRLKGCSREELKFSSFTADPVDIRIAYLRQEIKIMVERLSVYDYKGLTADRMGALYGHARIILNYLKNSDDQQNKEAILLSLALRTGSQCTRAYLDEFTSLNHQYSISENQKLTFSERAVFAALELRTRRFSDYYFEAMPKLRRLFPSLFFLSTDITEYHNFENFALTLGPYFHLRNTSLSLRVRDLSDFIMEKFYFYLFKHASSITNEKLLFSDYYNEDSLVQEVLKGDGYFGSLLVDWCNAIDPELYSAVFLDECLFPKGTDDLDIQTLARLMLVDLNIVEYTEPYMHEVEDEPHVESMACLRTLQKPFHGLAAQSSINLEVAESHVSVEQPAQNGMARHYAFFNPSASAETAATGRAAAFDTSCPDSVSFFH